MSLTAKAQAERMWGELPALRKILETKSIPDQYFGPFTASDNVFEQVTMPRPQLAFTGGLIFALPGCWSSVFGNLLAGRALRYLFENRVLDTDRRELRRGSELIAIPPHAFDLLDYLIRNREHMVSKDELIEAIWKGRTVSETALPAIDLPDGRKLETLSDCRAYILALPKTGEVGACRC